MPRIDEIYYSTPLDDSFSRFSNLREELLNEWARLADEVPEAKHDYEVAYAAAIKSAEGTVQIKEAEAVTKTSKEYLKLLKAEAKLEFVKAKIKWCETEVSVLQSRCAQARVEWQFSGLPTPTNQLAT